MKPPGRLALLADEFCHWALGRSIALSVAQGVIRPRQPNSGTATLVKPRSPRSGGAAGAGLYERRRPWDHELRLLRTGQLAPGGVPQPRHEIAFDRDVEYDFARLCSDQEARQAHCRLPAPRAGPSPRAPRALEFPSTRIVLLTCLLPGQTATCCSCPSAPTRLRTIRCMIAGRSRSSPRRRADDAGKVAMPLVSMLLPVQVLAPWHRLARRLRAQPLDGRPWFRRCGDAPRQ